MKSRLVNGLVSAWQSRGMLATLLLPLSCLYAVLVATRRAVYVRGIRSPANVSLPVVVVGNLTVGGTGKTPMCTSLVRLLQSAGRQPAIVSRGYRAARNTSPYLVSVDDNPADVGDEPLMLAQQLKVPVCICVDRAAAVEYLADRTDADIVVSDDGLQHLRMPRVAQVVVIDACRGFGNRWLLPAGPLRDYVTTLRGSDLLAYQIRYADDGFRHESLVKVSDRLRIADTLDQSFYLQPDHAVALGNGVKRKLSDFSAGPVHAVAGIGFPSRFFSALRHHGIEVIEHPRDDHHEFSEEDLCFQAKHPVLVTSKDAVKLRSMTSLPKTVIDRLYEVRTRVVISAPLERSLLQLVQSLQQ